MHRLRSVRHGGAATPMVALSLHALPLLVAAGGQQGELLTLGTLGSELLIEIEPAPSKPPGGTERIFTSEL